MGANTSYRQGQTLSTAYTGIAASVTVPAGCSIIRVSASTDAFVTITGSAVATAATTAIGMPVAGKVYEYFTVNPSDVVSFVQESTNGVGYVTPMSS